MRVAWRKRLGSRSAPVLAVAAALLLAACAQAAPAKAPAAAAKAPPAKGQHTASGGGGVISLTTISTLKSLFNRDAGRPRLVLILSPT